ncbi:MAG: efflux RND transporter permease subunit [Candidatus Xenobiia bacterium LiM19]
MLDRIITICLSQRVFILIVTIVIAVTGLYSALTLSTDAFPDVTGIQVEVISTLPGSSPLEMERYVTLPVERAMRGLPRLTGLRSVSKSGISVINIIFNDKTDIYFARSQVLERMIETRESLPEGTETTLGPLSTAMGGIYQYYLKENTPADSASEIERLTKLRTIQDWVVAPLLKSVPGVNEVDPLGGYIKEYHVIMHPEKLINYGISVREVYDAVMRNNSSGGGGFLEEGTEQYIVRSVGRAESAEDLRNIVLSWKSGARITVGDVADVKEGQAVRQGAAVMNGEGEIAGGSVMMLRGCNSREVVKAVKRAVDEINRSSVLPAGITIEPFYDRTFIIREAGETLGKALAEGIVLIVLVIFFFLRSFRGAYVIISALILSIAISAVIMKSTGLTANLMTLGGLIISLGMIIDSAIIQTENVQRHLKSDEKKELKLFTVLKAVLEVRKPSIFGELIIAITFLPLLALEGMEGKMFSPLALAVFTMLISSLILSIFVIPVICYYLLVPGGEKVSPFFEAIKQGYAKLLEKAIRHGRAVLAAAGILMVLSVAALSSLGTEFMPIMDEGAFDMDTIVIPGTPLDKSVEINMKLQQIIKTFPEIDNVVAKLGWSGIGLEAQSNSAGASTGTLRPRKYWKNARTREELVDKIRDAIAAVPGVVNSFSQPIQCRIDELVAGTKSQVVIKLFGDDLEVLREKSEEIGKVLSEVQGTKDLIVEQSAGQQYVVVKGSREKAAQYGINTGDIQDLVEMAVGGKSAGTFYEGARHSRIVLKFDERSRKNLSTLKNLPVDVPEQKIKLPLNQVADIVVEEGPVQIGHESGRRKILIQCNIHGRDIGGFVAECKKKIRTDVKLPAGCFLEWGGQFENQQKAFRKLAIIVPVTICVIFLLLFATFGSLSLATLVIFTLPLALIGGVLALFISRSYLSVPASIGFITLFGIAVLNGVVLVSYINQLREEGIELQEAIITGCTTRLRPVLMTASIAIFALLPLLFASGPGSEVQRPLATVVVGGLITSTFMSIIVLPVLYSRYVKGVKIQSREGED